MFYKISTGFLISVLTVSCYASASSTQAAQRAREYAELCAMIPECMERQRAELEQRKKEKQARDLWLATPRKPSLKIKEYKDMEEKLRDVKIIKKGIE